MTDVSLVLIVGGASFLVVGVLWRVVSWRRDVPALVRRLGSSDPQDRARAGIELVDRGLVRAARPLLERVPGDEDARVRLAVALAVAGRSSEVSARHRVAALRGWAAGELALQGRDQGPEVEPEA